MWTPFTSSLPDKVNIVNIERTISRMARPTYHHGDLRRALAAVALDLTRSRGAAAVTIRDVARRLEVSPAAIYRHFPDREALLAEVARAARMELARRMLEGLELVQSTEPRARAIQRFLASGRAYLRFAEATPNLLEVAFTCAPPLGSEPEEPNPWHLLGRTLDELVETGAMPAELRQGAENVAWSAVHGFAILSSSHAFDTSGEPHPDPEVLLAAIARSFGFEPVPST
jgi:AcrR family transcriptional regulator